jgi:amino acid transporter
MSTRSARDRTRAPERPGGLFVRQSSGLVREVGTADTLFYGLAQIGLAFVIFTIAAWAAYPGASIELATLFTVLGTLAVGITYALFSIAYPRSGGEYVFLSRVVHPLPGFVVSFGQAFWEAFYVGLNGAFLSLFGLAPLFGALGLQTGSAALTDLGEFFTQPLGMFLVGTTVILFFATVLTRATRTFFRVQRGFLLVAGASLALTFVVLLLGAVGVYDFEANLEARAGPGAYATVLSSAREAGTDLSPGFDLGQTLSFMVYPAFSILFAVLSVSFGGEIRNIKRSQIVGIPGAMVVAGAILILFPLLLREAVGTEFLRAASGGEFPLALEPLANTFTYLIADNPLLTLLMGIWTVVLIPYGGGVAMLYASRAVLAWSMDGVAPAALSDVSPRRHAPAKAVIAVALVGEVMLALYAFTDMFAVLSGLLGFAIGFIAVTLAGVVFPRLKRDVFDGSAAAIRVGGVPLITVTGAIGSLFLAFIIYRTFVDDAQGANTPASIRTAAGVLVVGAVWFLVARALQRRRGTNIDQRFAEIPFE